jgi:hypothetical protein
MVAALGNARDELAQIQRAAEIKIGAARANVILVQSRLDEFRTGLVREHVEAWRQHAGVLRQKAAEAGDETTVVAVRAERPGLGDSFEPKLEYIRNLLAAEADQADQTVTWLEGYLLRGDSLAGADLELLVSQLAPLPA